MTPDIHPTLRDAGPPPADPDPDADRRRELGAFLRSRRARLGPAEVGLPQGLRRRTPGLRREEVSLIAGVGVTWYTWLEQGREVHPSAELLAALARALRLDPAETRHLHLLAGRPAPLPAPAPGERVPEPLIRLLASLDGQPAYVMGRRWDILAWNPAAVALFGDYAALSGDARNVMHLVFADPRHRALLTEWEDVARAALAQFRADSARYLGDPAFDRLVRHLTRVSPEFRAWWPERDVARRLSGIKRIHHPAVGAMAFEHTALALDDGSDMRLVLFTPLTSDGTADALARLLAP